MLDALRAHAREHAVEQLHRFVLAEDAGVDRRDDVAGRERPHLTVGDGEGHPRRW